MWKSILKSDFKTVNDPDSDFAGLYNPNTDTIVLNVGAMSKVLRDSEGKNWADSDLYLNFYIDQIIDTLKHESIHEGVEKAGLTEAIQEKFGIEDDVWNLMKLHIYRHFFHELYTEVLDGTKWIDALKKAAAYWDKNFKVLYDKVMSTLDLPTVANVFIAGQINNEAEKMKQAALEMVEAIITWTYKYQKMLIDRMSKELKEEQAKGEISEEFREKGKGWLDRLKDFRDIEE
jgi:hypothetical protein